MQPPSHESAPRVWLITGASRGLGRAFTEAALEAGDRVAAAARTVVGLEDLAGAHEGRLLPLTVDVRDRQAVGAAVAAAVERFGRLDVVVNNAGTLSLGMVEEFAEAEARDQFETNLFGALWVSQAVMAPLRAQRSGHLVQVSSIGALCGSPLTGLYSASKAALEAMSEALAAEAAGFGVRVTILEPGGYWTGLHRDMHLTAPLDAYAPLRAEIEAAWADGSVDSAPALAARALMRLVDSDDPPRRLLLGSMAYDLAVDASRRRLEDWAAWEQVSRAAEHAIPEPAPAAVGGAR